MTIKYTKHESRNYKYRILKSGLTLD